MAHSTGAEEHLNRLKPAAFGSAEYAQEELLDENGKLDYNLLKPVGFEMPTYKYLRTGKVIGDCVKMGKAWAAEQSR